MKKSRIAVWVVVVPMLVLGLTAGCEEQHYDDEADFTNQSAIPVDSYSNDTLVNMYDTHDVDMDDNPDMNTDDSPDMNNDARRGGGHRPHRSLRH
jgi:hypothetical protein